MPKNSRDIVSYLEKVYGIDTARLNRIFRAIFEEGNQSAIREFPEAAKRLEFIPWEERVPILCEVYGMTEREILSLASLVSEINEDSLKRRTELRLEFDEKRPYGDERDFQLFPNCSHGEDLQICLINKKSYNLYPDLFFRPENRVRMCMPCVRNAIKIFGMDEKDRQAFIEELERKAKYYREKYGDECPNIGFLGDDPNDD